MDAARMLFRTGRVVGVCVACTWSPGTVLSDQVKNLVESALSSWESS
jgi:hypothetical protein